MISKVGNERWTMKNENVSVQEMMMGYVLTILYNAYTRTIYG